MANKPKKQVLTTAEREFEKIKSELTFSPNLQKPRLFSPQPERSQKSYLMAAQIPASLPSNVVILTEENKMAMQNENFVQKSIQRMV